MFERLMIATWQSFIVIFDAERHRGMQPPAASSCNTSGQRVAMPPQPPASPLLLTDGMLQASRDAAFDVPHLRQAGHQRAQAGRQHRVHHALRQIKHAVGAKGCKRCRIEKRGQREEIVKSLPLAAPLQASATFSAAPAM